MKSQGLKKFLEEVTLPNLETFLLTHKSTEELPYTHTYMLNGATVPDSMKNGSWHIPETELDVFYEIYANEIQTDNISKGTGLCMTEKHIPIYGPVIIDLDYKFEKCPNGRPINDETIKCFVSQLTKILKEMFGNGHNYMCIVLRRPHGYYNAKQKKYVDGLHIHFPEIVCEYTYHFLLREKFMKTNKINIIGCNDPMEKIYDKSIIKDTNWCPYGSTKPNIGAYEIYETYNTMIDKDLLLATSLLGRIKMLSIRNKSEYLIKPLSKISTIQLKETSNTKSKTPNKTRAKTTSDNTANIQPHIDKNTKEMDVLKQQYATIDKQLRNRLDLLNPERAENYNDWFTICHIIRNTGGSFRLFVEYSKKSEKKYEYEMCINVWNKNNPNREKKATMNKLIMFCMEDNKQQYCELLRLEGNTVQSLLNELHDIGGGSDNNFAKIFHHLYPKLFIYDPLAQGGNKKEGTWLTYDEFGKYHICDGMQKAKQILSDEIHKIVKNDYMNRLDMLMESISENDKMTEKQKQAAIAGYKQKGESLLLKLKNTVSKCNIIEQLKEFYYREKIFEKMDEVNPYLVGFDNGVFDLENREFRKALPEELMYLSTGYDYNNADKKYVKELQKLIESIYPNKEEREYIMTVSSFVLSGIMHLQEFYMLIGTGGNGKGIMTLLTTITMGQKYCAGINIECFKNRGNISSNEKSQQLAGCKYARAVFVTECNFKEGEEFESNLVKTMSGGDMQNCKFLYKEQTTYIPKFNLYFITNDQIPIKINDNSIPRRARICPHRVSFVDKNDYEENNKYVALAVIGLEENIKKDSGYKFAFFEILTKYYYDFMDNGKKLVVPDSLIKENIAFKDLNNPIGNFLRDCLVITKSKADKIRVSSIVKTLAGYDDSMNESASGISKFLAKKNVEITRIKGYPTCSGVKFKAYDELHKIITPECLELLLDEGLVTKNNC